MLYYIHGYLSGPDGTKGELFKKELNAIPIKYRDVEPEDLIISDCLNEIKEVIKFDSDPILIGSSLGGFLSVKTAMNMKIHNLILINPALIPPSVDISTLNGMPQNIFQEMYDTNIFTSKIDTDITILVGTNDKVVPNEWSIEFAKSQEAKIYFYNDDHRFSNYINDLPGIIRKLI